MSSSKQNTRSFKNHHILPEFESSPQLLLSAPYLIRYLNHEIIVPEWSFLYYEQIVKFSLFCFWFDLKIQKILEDIVG